MEKLSCKRFVLPNHLVSPVIRDGKSKKKVWFRTGNVVTRIVHMIDE